MQKPPRQVPGIANLRPQISRDTLPPIQSPLGMGQMQQPPPSPQASISDSVQELAMQIYAELATKHIQHNHETDRETLLTLARSAQQAALAYFQALGVQFDSTDQAG